MPPKIVKVSLSYPPERAQSAEETRQEMANMARGVTKRIKVALRAGTSCARLDIFAAIEPNFRARACILVAKAVASRGTP